MRADLKEFDWTGELHKTVVQSLTTSFGLEFLLFDDKKGGDVDTIHNVRQGVWATDSEKEKYEQREIYNRKSLKVDEHKNYKEKNRIDSILQADGKLNDSYTGEKIPNKKGQRDLDHVISAKEVYDDPARLLAELDTTELVSRDPNLKSTNKSINRSKSALKVDGFLDNRLPKSIENTEVNIASKQKALEA